LAVSTSLLWTIVFIVAIVVGLLAYLVIKTTKRQVFTGSEGMIGKVATVKSESMVYVNGALWKAVCDVPMTPGAKVKIEAVDSLTLKVKLIES
jgi:membrane protein implicated in regulation of membrane protease activity